MAFKARELYSVLVASSFRHSELRRISPSPNWAGGAAEAAIDGEPNVALVVVAQEVPAGELIDHMSIDVLVRDFGGRNR